jgi:dTDP-4-dehydrorhamnose 3,5-epimerase
MEVIDTGIKGLLLLQPKVFGDDRGYFYESYNHRLFRELSGLDIEFVQDNQSKSKKDVVRGLHFQKPPYAQDKLVRVLQGSVLDVAVDLRKESETYGKVYSVVLSAANHLQLFVPKGFAHGFATLEDDTVFVYKCSDYYNKASEDCILWNDPSLQVPWDISQAIVSDKDREGKFFVNFESPF